MAVDGVAPRAKMNQQRSRRFRSAKDAEVLEQKARSRGEEVASERFDSNCITPGTEFMSRLHEALRYFVKSKISTDSMWQKCRVILSGHDCPGEGEHKIMDYIRYLKSQKDYNPNTRHCLYGLDADLIILGLCTHELHFVVLREEVKFGRKTKRTSVEETRFFLLHLGLFREYLEIEFDELRRQYSSFDIANLIDDWVLMGFLVGNDFIPHLPCLHISSNALPLLYKTYIKVYSTLEGNINVNGILNLERLEKYFVALSEVEFELFKENYADLKYFEAKQSKNGVDEAFDFDVSDISKNNTDNDLAAFIESSRQFFEDDDKNSDNEAEHIFDEFETYKRNYYIKKLHQDEMSSKLKQEQAIGYITALQWILDYYYRGVQSWDWYYPHHYAPFISDLKNFKHHNVQFNIGKPFLPFEQLLAVLPAASKQLLPPAYRNLMTSPSSELIEFYPSDFETDLNGKKQEWEAVVLIPFIDESILLHSMKACEQDLTANEVKRNRHGPMFQYDFNEESQGNTPGIYSLKALYHVFCTEKPIWSSEISIPAVRTVCVELENASRTVFFSGFPTMKHLKYDFQIKNGRVKVFDYASRYENVILIPKERPAFDDIFVVAEKFLNQVVFIGWPHLIKAKIVAISNKEKIIDSDGIKNMEPKIFQLQSKNAQEHLTSRMGIEFKDFSVMVHVKTHVGKTYVCGSQGKITINDAWSPSVTAYPAQGVVSDIAVHSELAGQHKQIETLFPVNSTIFFVGNPYFGSEGTVLNPLLVYECGRLKINITVLPEPDFSEARHAQTQLELDYVNSYQASAIVGLHAKCLGRITGTVLVVAGARRSNLADNISKTNIGLQLKFPKQQEERAGYARRLNNQWYYSSKSIALVQLYCEKFPMIVEYLSKSSDRSEFCFEADLFPDSVGENCVEEIVHWLKTQDHMKAERIACGSKTVEKEAVEKVLDSIEKLKTLPVKTVKLQVKPHLLLKPDISLPDMYKSRRAVCLFDRVVIVKTTYMVPLGSKGTVVGIYPVSDPNPVRLECVKTVDNFFEVLFDKHLANGNDIHGIALERVYKVPESSVLLILNDDSKQTMELDNKYSRVSNENTAKTIIGTHILKEPIKSIDSKPTNNQSLSNALPNSSSKKKTNVGGDDFWMPLANTTAKHSYVQTSQQLPNNDLFDESTIMPNTATVFQNYHTQPSSVPIPDECQAGTQVLKNLLGLAPSHPNAIPPILKSTESFVDLPKPPLNWNSNPRNQSNLTNTQNVSNISQKVNQNRMNLAMNSFGMIHQTPPAPLAIFGSNAMTLEVIADKRAYEKNAYCPQQSSMYSPRSLNQKGAFTPMHGNRNNATIQSIIDTVNVDNIEQNIEIVTLTEPSCSTQITNSSANSSQQPESNNADNSIINMNKPKDTRKKAPRTPKIGAKFDYAL